MRHGPRPWDALFRCHVIRERRCSSHRGGQFERLKRWIISETVARSRRWLDTALFSSLYVNPCRVCALSAETPTRNTISGHLFRTNTQSRRPIIYSVGHALAAAESNSHPPRPRFPPSAPLSTCRDAVFILRLF